MPGFELIDDSERDAVTSVFDEGGVLFAHGFEAARKKFHVREFEANCCDYFGIRYSHALSSGTASIKCALKAVGVTPGAEVITQGFNFIATVEAILDCGAIPIICSIDNNLHLDIDDCISKITPNTSAIVIVNMLGFPGPISRLRSRIIDAGFSIPVIEDACESVGALVGTKYSGTCADIGVFSFDHGKNLTCGEGGLILTDNPGYSQFVSSYSDHGHSLDPYRSRGNDIALMPGFNYRMTEMQAAVGKIQLSKLATLIDLHKLRYSILFQALSRRFNIRHEATCLDIPSYDTFMLLDLNNQLKNSIIFTMQNHGLCPKNIPDAMFWHCSAFWHHALTPAQLENGKSVLQLLSSAVAIPILARKPLIDYQRLAEALLML